jgi:hypothetical protein
MSHNRLREADDPLPTVDESADQLRRAGWCCGDFATASGWVVTGTNGGRTYWRRGAGTEGPEHTSAASPAALVLDVLEGERRPRLLEA